MGKWRLLLPLLYMVDILAWVLGVQVVVVLCHLLLLSLIVLLALRLLLCGRMYIVVVVAWQGLLGVNRLHWMVACGMATSACTEDKKLF